MKRLLTFVVATLLLAGCAGDLATTATYTNPILGGDYPDPTIMREGEDYYMTHSAFDYQPGLTVFHSKDLVNWTPISYALKTYLGSCGHPTSASTAISTTSTSP